MTMMAETLQRNSVVLVNTHHTSTISLSLSIFSGKYSEIDGQDTQARHKHLQQSSPLQDKK